MQLFKGYVITKDKKSIEKIKGRNDFKTLDQVQSLPEYAGVLAAETILIDIDDFETSEILFRIVQDLQMKCRVYKTSRGKHFLFKNNGVESNKTHCTLSVGLIADIKLGTRNSYEILKFDGKDREIIHDAEDAIQTVPKWMFPIKTNMEFLHMDAGDGRNQSLFNYILTLQSNDFNKEETRECIRIINQYVLKEPLPERELETILRNDAFPAAGTINKFNHAIFGDALISELNLISVHGSLYTYSNGVYLPKDNDQVNAIIINRMPELKINQRREIIEFIRGRGSKTIPHSNIKQINLKNGILGFNANKETKTFDVNLIEHSPQIIHFKQFNAEYNPGIDYPLLDETLNKVFCGDEELLSLFDEIIGYLMMDHVNFQKCFFFVGKPSGGKSNILNMITKFIRKQNVSTLNLKDLNDKFRLSNIVNKTANILADLDQTTVKESGNFKSLVTGDGVIVEEKYGKPFTYYNTAKLLFSCNTLPHFTDKGGVMRRPIIIPFKHEFKKTDPDYNPFIDEDLSTPECMSALLNRGIAGYQRLYLNGGFTESSAVQSELKKFKVNNSNVLTWMHECEFDEDKLQREFIKDLYRMFMGWCHRNSCNPQSRRSFVDEICNEFELKTKQKRIPGTSERDAMFVK